MSGRFGTSKDLAEILRGGVIMDVTNPKEAEIAQKAGAGCSNGVRKGTG